MNWKHHDKRQRKLALVAFAQKQITAQEMHEVISGWADIKEASLCVPDSAGWGWGVRKIPLKGRKAR